MEFVEHDISWFHAQARKEGITLTEEDLQHLCGEVNRVRKELASMLVHHPDGFEPAYRFVALPTRPGRAPWLPELRSHQ